MIVLSQIEENKLLSDYSRIAWKLVHRFSRGKASSVFSKEDLYQECMLVLVKHMNKCETKEQLRRIQTMNLVNAMVRFVLRGQAIRLDPNRTDKVKITLSELKSSVPISQLIDLDDGATEDDIIARIDFERFFETLPEDHRCAIKQMSQGFKQREIGQHMGKTQQWAQWVRKTTREKYDAYCAS